MNPLDLVAAAPWTKVVFTTYALSLSFFEAVLLDRLVRGGGRDVSILADPEGVRAALSEHGARRAGREYDVEPVSCTSGMFHPKLSVFLAADDAHLLVGSGNLTFGGWGGNLEFVEHLHPSFAPDVFDDAADFFELMTIADNVVGEVGAQCTMLAEFLHARAGTANRHGDIRLLHSLNVPILSAVREYADDLGGATRLTAISPFFDLNGSGMARMARDLGCDDVRVHTHPTGAVRGNGSFPWPFGASIRLEPVSLEQIGADKRPLHAKAFEVLCRKGRLLLSGSANATGAGLLGRNVEASILRVQRGTLLGWTSTPGLIPAREITDADDEQEDDEPRAAVLRAVLNGEIISGRIFGAKLTGEVQAVVKTARAEIELGSCEIDPDGRFIVASHELDAGVWALGRLTLRLSRADVAAEGFVSIAFASELIRRSGPIAKRIFAILAGTETPEDVAAIMAWMRDNPDRLAKASIQSGGGGGDEIDQQPSFVPLTALQPGQWAKGIGNHDPANPDRAWRHAMQMLRGAFARPRGPWRSGTDNDDDDDDDLPAREKRAREEERFNAAALRHFDDLLEAMLHPAHNGKNADMALSIAHFLADRIRPAPSKVRLWLSHILGQFASFEGFDPPSPVCAVLIYFATDGSDDAAIHARRFLLQRQCDLATVVFAEVDFSAFVEILGDGLDLADFLEHVRHVQTPGEQVRAFLATADGDAHQSSFPTLEKSPHWLRLAKALSDKDKRQRLVVYERMPTACPKCHMRFPLAVLEDLRRQSVASCCGRFLLNTEL